VSQFNVKHPTGEFTVHVYCVAVQCIQQPIHMEWICLLTHVIPRLCDDL